MPFQILDAKVYQLNDEDVWILAEIETHPKVRELDIDIHAKDKRTLHHLFQKFLETLPNNKDQIFLKGKLNGRVIGFLGIHRKSKRMKQ